MNFSWMLPFGQQLLDGVVTTVELLLLSGVFGFLLALLVAFGLLARNRWVALTCSSYTTVIRGTPLLVQIYVMYYGVGSLFASFPWLRGSVLWPYLREGFCYVVLALTLSVGGYVGEVIRGGLRGVPKGELEAARAMGMSRLLTIRRIWLPRAIQILLPSLAGESVLLLKSTALASTVAVMDVLGAANYVRAQTLRTYEPLLLIAAIYIVFAMVIERLFRRLERRIPTQVVL